MPYLCIRMAQLNLFYIPQSPYAEALAFQEILFKQLLDLKAAGKPTSNSVIILEHEPVYTLGKSGNEGNLKVPVEETGARFFKTNRGGDITYHGPGQLTVYPLFDLDNIGIGVREYVERLESCIIDCIAEYGIKGERLESASGVWLDAHSAKPRKICAIGIKVSRGVSMHGLAFNVNTDLSFFNHIIPCGLEDKGVTSLQEELGKEIPILQVAEKVWESFRKTF